MSLAGGIFALIATVGSGRIIAGSLAVRGSRGSPRAVRCGAGDGWRDVAPTVHASLAACHGGGQVRMDFYGQGANAVMPDAAPAASRNPVSLMVLLP